MRRICFWFPRPQRICLPLYLRIERFGPEPDPWRIFSPEEILKDNDHFKDLIDDGLIKKEAIVDAVTLMAISKLTANLSGPVKGVFEPVLKEQQAKMEKAFSGGGKEGI